MNRKLYCLIPTRDYEYEELEKFLPLLPKQRRDKVMVSKSDSRKAELILSGLFMGYCFKRELGKNIADLQFERTALGKPYLANNTDIDFSLSHTKNAFVFAISNLKIGVDIEYTDRVEKNFLALASRFFSKQEYDYILNSKNTSGHNFYNIWTMKEAYIKANGRSIQELKKFNVFNVNKPQNGEFYKFRNWMLGEYAIGLCLKSKYSDIKDEYEIEVISEKDIGL